MVDTPVHGVKKSIDQNSENSLKNMSFDELRKRARQLESDIDSKLIDISKLSAHSGNKITSQSNGDNVPLISNDQKYESVCSEIEYLLNALAEVNEKMSNSSSNNFSGIHTLQRHKDILQDYTREFQRIQNSVKSRKERDQLLSSNRSNDLITGLSRRDLFLKENDHLMNSERMIDDQIAIAMETKDHLKGQREAFKLIQTKVNDLSNRFPLINSLMTKINIRKRRDALILGAVISLCFIFVFWWYFG